MGSLRCPGKEWESSVDLAHLSGNTHPQIPQFDEPLWTDPGLKSKISVCDLISTTKKKKNHRQGMNCRTFSKNLHTRKKATTLGKNQRFWPPLRSLPLALHSGSCLKVKVLPNCNTGSQLVFCYIQETLKELMWLDVLPASFACCLSFVFWLVCAWNTVD